MANLVVLFGANFGFLPGATCVPLPGGSFFPGWATSGAPTATSAANETVPATTARRRAFMSDLQKLIILRGCVRMPEG